MKGVEYMKIAIFGYGNIGHGVEIAVNRNVDMELTGIFTHRSPQDVHSVTGAPVYSADRIDEFTDEIDVVVICGGSARELPVITPQLAARFNVVDSFDNHAHIPEHFDAVDAAARSGGHTALISGGWDPGMFSLARLYGDAILPCGKSYTFWGRGVSQGHSDAIRHIPGVADARQYTVPIQAALDRVRSGEQPELSTREKHLRECYVVAEQSADRDAIAQAIKTMPDYFADYDTDVHFVSAEELKRNHAGLPHGGFVIRTGTTGINDQHNHRIEYRLELDSNPEFTASALAALARAVYRLAQRGDAGCKTIFDIAPADLIAVDRETLRREYL